MKKPFGRLAMLSLVVVSMLLTSVFWAGPGTVRAQDEESLAGDVPVDSLEAAGPLGPDIPYDPGEGPGLPVETPPDNSLTPDGMPLDDMAPAPEAVAPPEGDAAMPGVAGADSNAESPVVEPNGGGFAYPGIGFSHLSTSDNISIFVTFLQSPSLNKLPDRVVFPTVLLNPLGSNTSYHNHPLGVFYSPAASQWSVLNEDTTIMPAGVAFNAFKPAQNSIFFTHTATAANILGDLTLLDNAYLNNNPGALVFAIPAFNPGGVGGMYYNHNIGVYYRAESQKWGIYNEDDAVVTENSKFFVYVSHPAYDMAFRHITTAASTTANYTILDHPLLNNNPNAVINVTHEYPTGVLGQYLNQVLGVWYSASRGRWTIYFNSGATMPDGYHFNVLVQANKEAHTVFKADATNISSYWAVIDHPLLNNNPNALLYVTHNYNPPGSTAHVIDNHPLSVDYVASHWVVYHADFQAIAVNTYYNLYITYPKANAYSVEVDDQNATASTLRLSHSQLNDHADAVFITTQNFNPGDGIKGATYGYSNYAAYSGGIWNILRVGGPDYPMENAYNVLIPLENGFTHIVTAGSKPYPAETCIDNGLTNAQPTATVFAYVNGTPAGGGGSYLNKPIGVFYKADWKKWCIYVEDTSVNIPLGTAFNVFVENPRVFIPVVRK